MNENDFIYSRLRAAGRLENKTNPISNVSMASSLYGSCFLGSGPDRGRSPVEWGEIPYVRPYVRTSIRPSPPALLALQAGPQTPLAGPKAPLASPCALQAGPHTARADPHTHQAGPQTPLAGPKTPLVGLQTPLASPLTL